MARAEARATRAWRSWLRGGRMALALGALAFAAMLMLPPDVAIARWGHHHRVKSDNDGDDNSSGNSNSNSSNSGSATSSSPSNPGDGNAGGVSVTPHDVNPGGYRGGSYSGIPLGSNPSAPSLGFGFNNNGGAVRATIPFGGPHRLGAPPHHASHPILSIPFEHAGHRGGLAHALAPPGGPRHALSYGDTGTPGGLFGGTPKLTNRLIRSVTTTYSDHFAHRLNHQLRMQEPGGMKQVTAPASGAAAPGGNDLASKLARAKHALASAVAPRAGAPGGVNRVAPATIVNNRFAGIGTNALEARVFTVPPPGETRYVPREIVVAAPPGLSTEQIADIARRHGLSPVAGGTFASSGLTLQRWRVPDNRPVGEVIRALQAETGLQGAQPNFRFKLAQAAGLSEQPADGFTAQYAPAKLHLVQAHRLATGSGITVAVIDTGIDRTHPDLAGSIVAGFDAIGAREPPDAHGTAIAGAIVAHARLMGVAPGARLLAIRAFSTAGPDAEATTMTIVRSIEWALAHGARVINMSFAGARDPVIGRALAAARRKGVVLIAAAGNGGPDSPPLYPAADSNVIAVSATDIDDRILDVANRGRQVAVAAPGVDVLLPAPHARYQIATGTSFAAAEVAGIAALMLARNPHLTPDDVRSALVATAHDLGPKGRDDIFGAGLADAYRAVLAAINSNTPTVAAVK